MSRRASIDEAQEAVVEEPLHVKYRPRSLKDVLGQDAITAALKDNLKAKSRPHSFLFTGPSGTGKTTLSRIMAAELGCAGNVVEVDAASNSGIDAMKEVLAGVRYHGFGSSPNRAYIIDECHALSKQAWQSLLKPIEEPPPHVFFFLCTTETGKVPETIVTRCQNYSLKSVRFADLMDLLEAVCSKEGLDAPPAVLEVVARKCDGSPRMALVMLAMTQRCRSADEAEDLLDQPLDNKEIIELCRLAIDRELTWSKLQATLKAMPDLNAETARIVLVNYLQKCILGAKSERDAIRLLNLAGPFAQPFASSDKLMPLLLAFADAIFKD